MNNVIGKDGDGFLPQCRGVWLHLVPQALEC